MRPDLFYYDDYTPEKLRSMLLDFLDLSREDLDFGLSEEEQQQAETHLNDIITFFSESWIIDFIDQHNDLNPKDVLLYLIMANDTDAVLSIAEEDIDLSHKLIQDFASLGNLAKSFGIQFSRLNRREGNIPLLPDDAVKTAILTREIEESIHEAFQLIIMAYKFGLINSNNISCDRAKQAERDLMSTLVSMEEYGNGLISESCTGKEFSQTPIDNLIFYRTDEHKFYEYTGGKWAELEESDINNEVRNYWFKFSNLNTVEDNATLKISTDTYKSHIRWILKPALDGVSENLGIRLDAQTPTGGDMPWKIELDLASNALRKSFAQALNLARNISNQLYESHHTESHHFLLFDFSTVSDITLFNRITDYYAPLNLFPRISD
ncbi:MAG: hypothetical protein P9M06_00045 [Candidatus Saelkia tenebricola]|nr:hypothetical protein [Candidatus Saelkia tenebricola]